MHKNFLVFSVKKNKKTSVLKVFSPCLDDKQKGKRIKERDSTIIRITTTARLDRKSRKRNNCFTHQHQHKHQHVIEIDDDDKDDGRTQHRIQHLLDFNIVGSSVCLKFGSVHG